MVVLLLNKFVLWRGERLVVGEEDLATKIGKNEKKIIQGKEFNFLFFEENRKKIEKRPKILFNNNKMIIKSYL